MTRHVVGRVHDVAPGQLRTDRLGHACPRCRQPVSLPGTWRDGDTFACCFVCVEELRPAHPMPARRLTGYAWLDEALSAT